MQSFLRSRKRNVKQFTKHSYTFEKTQFKTIDETYIYLRENEHNMTSYQQLHLKTEKFQLKHEKSLYLRENEQKY